MKPGGTDGKHACTAALVIAAACFVMVFVSTAAVAGEPQIGKITGALKRVQKAADEFTIDEQEEQDLGAEISARIRDRYGVVQDAAVTRYVSLVGTVLAQASSRPNLPWKFIVLDTDGVNAFAAPGGYIHITRGALALVTSEAELATVLAHEITHVTEKHTLDAIQKGMLAQAGAREVNRRVDMKKGSEYFNRAVNVGTDVVLKGFGRKEELAADQKGVRLANSIGYAPGSLADFLTRLSDRNRESTTKQGLFASHPDMQERLRLLRSQVTSERLTASATLADRYRKFITYQPASQAEIAGVEEGASGLTGGGGKSATKKDDTKKAEAKKDDPPPKKKGFGLAGLMQPAPERQKSAEVTGSAAARGVDRELGAKGGPVKTIVVVSLTPAEIAAFKKEGNLR